jgi:hypothetical protein
VRKILANPRLAGLTFYRGEPVELDDGVQADWPAILDETTWRDLNAVLDDPGRKAPRGVRTLLGGLAKCQCGNQATASHNGSGVEVYRCHPASQNGRQGPHAALHRQPVNQFVTEVIVARLSRDDVADLIAPRRADTTGLRNEAARIRKNLDGLAADRVDGLISRSQLIKATERGRERLAEVSALLDQAGGLSILAPFAGWERAAEVWAALDLARQRAVTGVLCSVTLLPAGRKAGTFDPATVVVDWIQGTA